MPQKQPMRDVVVVLPGIMGSVLKKDGKVVWGFSAGALGTALFSLGGSLRKSLMLNGDDPDADDLGDGVVADAMLPDLHLLPGVWKIDGYTRVVNSISERFDVTVNRNLFPFAYDWRRDNRVAARRLARQTHEWLTRWRQESGNPNARLILIGHSMGGLVSRYFLEVLGGWENTRALITFGTPYRGALNALDGLSNGLKKGPFDLTELARSFTSLYQLLPIFQCYDPGNGRLERVAEAAAGVPGVDAARARDALAFHREIEAAVQANSANERYRTSGYRVYPIVGNQQETLVAGRRSGSGVTMLHQHPELDFTGDGTVPRPSATPIEYSDQGREMFAATRHGSLQNADAVLVHLDGVLSGFAKSYATLRGDQKEPAPPPPPALQALPPVKVSLEVEDLYVEGEAIEVRARPDHPGVQLVAKLSGTGAAGAQPVPLRPGADGWQTARVGPLPAGAYRVAISGPDVEPAADSFAVANPAAAVV